MDCTVYIDVFVFGVHVIKTTLPLKPGGDVFFTAHVRAATTRHTSSLRRRIGASLGIILDAVLTFKAQN